MLIKKIKQIIKSAFKETYLFEQLDYGTSKGSGKIEITVTVLCLFHFSSCFRGGGSGLRSGGFTSLGTKTKLWTNVSRLFLREENLCLYFILFLWSQVQLKYSLSLFFLSLSFSLSQFSCFFGLTLCCCKWEYIFKKGKKKNKKKSLTSFRVPKLNDSELGCFKSWWRIKIHPSPVRTQVSVLFICAQKKTQYTFVFKLFYLR